MTSLRYSSHFHFWYLRQIENNHGAFIIIKVKMLMGIIRLFFDEYQLNAVIFTMVAEKIGIRGEKERARREGEIFFDWKHEWRNNVGNDTALLNEFDKYIFLFHLSYYFHKDTKSTHTRPPLYASVYMYINELILYAFHIKYIINEYAPTMR